MPDPISWAQSGPYFLFALMIGYLCGSAPFGLIIARLGGKGDIRTIGSGNIGATNVLRTGSKPLAVLTLLADMAKATLPILYFSLNWGTDAAVSAAFGAFLGHLFPVWLKFAGGKGVATYIGVLFGLTIPGAVLFCLTWLVAFAITRMSSVAGLLSAAIMPVAAWIYAEPQLAELFLAMTILLWLKHRANISRLIRRTEPRIGEKRD